MKPAAKPVIGVTALLLVAVGCHDGNSRVEKPVASSDQLPVSPASPVSGGSPPPEGVAAGSASSTSAPSEFTGRVVETMNSGGYTYVQVDTGAKTIWAAANVFEVKVGDVVVVPAGMPMPNFHSNTLNRDFDLIYFTGGIRIVGDGQSPSLALGQLPGGHPPLPGGKAQQTPALPGGHPPLPGTGQAADPTAHSRAHAPAGTQIEPGSIEKPDGGRTVGEVFETRAQLAGQEVIVRGKVVKYTASILKRNWIHLKDGTGSAGSDDLTVTTTDQAAVGDTVVVRGTVTVDKDFGAGYKYAVLIENASVTVE